MRSEQEDERRELSEEGMRLSAMADEADAARVRLKEEEGQITTRRVQLDEEKRRIALAQDELLRVQSEQEHKRKELKEEGIALKGYADSLRIRVETLVKREKSCSEMEDVVESRFDALSGRERACVSREENIDNQAKEIAMRAVDIQRREDSCAKRELEIGNSLR